ncbi:tranposase [Streptococcus pneumoniae]|nr:tranposase [Streptococcus pneumoniae]
MRIYLHEPLIITVSQGFTSLSDISATHFEQLHIMTIVQSGVTVSRTSLSSEDTVIVDATEVKINRPKKRISE